MRTHSKKLRDKLNSEPLLHSLCLNLQNQLHKITSTSSPKSGEKKSLIPDLQCRDGKNQKKLLQIALGISIYSRILINFLEMEAQHKTR